MDRVLQITGSENERFWRIGLFGVGERYRAGAEPVVLLFGLCKSQHYNQNIPQKWIIQSLHSYGLHM